MMLIKSPNEENCNIKKISMYSVKRVNYHSYAKQCANLCILNSSKGVKSDRKYKVYKDKRKLNT